jgi:hypothetical protein
MVEVFVGGRWVPRGKAVGVPGSRARAVFPIVWERGKNGPHKVTSPPLPPRPPATPVPSDDRTIYKIIKKEKSPVLSSVILYSRII